MKIKWLGHACFLITTENGTRIITDPFNDEIGYKTPSGRADIVTVSHQHGDHNYVAGISGDYKLISEPGRQEVGGIVINGVPTYHDEEGGAKRGPNLIFTFEVDGVKLCHCGDLGHLLTPEQVAEIGKVDVLLIPVGGFFTLDVQKAVEVVGQLSPVTVIPMHYRSPYLKGHIANVLGTVEPFVTAMGKKPIVADELTVHKSTAASGCEIVLLNY